MTADPLLIRRSAADPRAPILVTGLSSAAVLNGAGAFSFNRETRGADVDWGGVYGEGVRLVGPWWIRLRYGSGTTWTMTESLARLTASRARLLSTHEGPGLRAEQEIVALPDRPGVGRRLRLTASDGAVGPLTIETSFVPELAPVLVEGIKPSTYEAEPTPTGLRVSAFGSSFEFAGSPVPQRLRLDGEPWDRRARRGPLFTVTAESDFPAVPAGGLEVDWLLWGGVARTVRHQPNTAGELLAGARSWGSSAEQRRADWVARTPVLRLPDAPDLELGYGLARDALRSLYFGPEPEFTGLVAGYPWYAALWCRDMGWMLPAVLWMGDLDWVERSLRTVFRFQARKRLPALAGSPGELPMQVGPGPIFLYGTSDTTLYYPPLVARCALHGARTALATELFPALERVAAWGRAKQDASTGLLRNGDETAPLQATAAEHGRIHYGFDSVDTTIWDSTDRRAHAIDVQVLWADALRALSWTAGTLGRADDARGWADAAEGVARSVADRYWWESEGYLYDSIASDGRPVAKVRPNALLAVARRYVTGDRAVRALRRALRDDLSAEWGLRTLASSDPTYDPGAYHDGQVWPITSAWAIDAAFAVGETAVAGDGLLRWARRLAAEGGLLNECYRGDRPEPYDSCFLLGFSVAPFLSSLFEGLWGIRPGPAPFALALSPGFPPGWDRGSLEGVALFGGRLDLTWERPAVTVRWHGPRPLAVRAGDTPTTVPDGGTARFDVSRPPHTS